MLIYSEGTLKTFPMNNNNYIINAVNKTDFGSEIWTDAPAPPKSSNEGGIIAVELSEIALASYPPRLVTREHGGKV